MVSRLIHQEINNNIDIFACQSKSKTTVSVVQVFLPVMRERRSLEVTEEYSEGIQIIQKERITYEIH